MVSACHGAEPAQMAQMVQTRRIATFNDTPNAPAYALEVASTQEAHARGLMYRRSLAPLSGMLFVFDTDAPRQFWMKNTYISLDMIFIDQSMHVTGIVEHAEPLSLAERGPNRACRYVIELAGGEALRLGITTGSRVWLREPA